MKNRLLDRKSDQFFFIPNSKTPDISDIRFRLIVPSLVVINALLKYSKVQIKANIISTEKYKVCNENIKISRIIQNKFINSITKLLEYINARVRSSDKNHY